MKAGITKDAKTNDRDLQEAYARFLLRRKEERRIQSDLTVFDVCITYLEYAKKNGAQGGRAASQYELPLGQE